jgi:hypothetical protein
MTEPKTIHFDGPCPFLTCLEEGPHDHPICPDCGAVRYGNLYCPTSRAYYQEHREEIIANLKAMLQRAFQVILPNPPGGKEP